MSKNVFTPDGGPHRTSRVLDVSNGLKRMGEFEAAEMLAGYAAFLREREVRTDSAGYTLGPVIDGGMDPRECEAAQPVAWLDMGKGEAQLVFSKKGNSNRASKKQAAHLFESVEEGYHPLYLHAPMLASARVPDVMQLPEVLGMHAGNIATLKQYCYAYGWNDCRHAMLATAPKPEKE